MNEEEVNECRKTLLTVDGRGKQAKEMALGRLELHWQKLGAEMMKAATLSEAACNDKAWPLLSEIVDIAVENIKKGGDRRWLTVVSHVGPVR